MVTFDRYIAWNGSRKKIPLIALVLPSKSSKLNPPIIQHHHVHIKWAMNETAGFKGDNSLQCALFCHRVIINVFNVIACGLLMISFPLSSFSLGLSSSPIFEEELRWKCKTPFLSFSERSINTLHVPCPRFVVFSSVVLSSPCFLAIFYRVSTKFGYIGDFTVIFIHGILLFYVM